MRGSDGACVCGGGAEGVAPQGAACHSAVVLIDMSIVTEREVESKRGRGTQDMRIVKLRKIKRREG